MSFKAESPVILCATPRLARGLQMVYHRNQQQSGAKRWQAPNITTLTDWLNTTIETSILNGEIDANNIPTHAINSTQEGLLWEQSIQQSLKSNAAAELFDTSGLASAAMEANRFLTEWHLMLTEEDLTEETQQFIHWREDFQTRCKQANVLEAVRYEAWQITCLQKDAGDLPSSIQFAGFDRVNPNLKRLMSVLEKRGVSISTYPLTFDTAQQCTHVKLNDQDDEYRAAVAWVKEQLDQNSNAKLAIIVPELDALRAKLSNLLDDVFHPETVAVAHAELTRCYDFSLGVALSSIPIVETALNLLRFAWNQQPMLQTEIAPLIHSMYWSASQQEADTRAKFEARMRQNLPLSITPFRLLRFLQHTCEGEHALPLIKLLEDTNALMDVAKEHNRFANPKRWADVFKKALEATHWQGERTLSSHEYQAVKAFDKVLQELGSLATLMGNISANEAIKRLTQLCKSHIFQPERKTQASIQVMGMLEATAEPLDGIWVMGMNDHVWPPIARHNALLPAHIQRKAKTPNASSEVQTAFAEAIHQRLIKSARKVIFSSAAKNGERELRASPLMHRIPKAECSQQPIETLAEKLARVSTNDWQWIDDSQAPPIVSGEHVSGGTGLLKAQAICPAWAFYQYRLNARKLDEPVNGLNVMDRGSLVHAVLAKFWQNKTQAAWMDSLPDELKNELLSISQEVLATFNAERNNSFSETFLTLEKERLSTLVFAWLIEVEMLRPQGFSVVACEQENNIDIEGIRIKLIIDRIDQLDDGRLIVIDYKTGQLLDYKNWGQQRITEPQLPIYAAFILQGNQASEVGAVCYAKVKTANHAFVGIASSEELVQGATVFNDKRGRKIFDEENFPNWQSVITHWRKCITQTALSLKQGDSAVIVENENQLAFCEVSAILRLPERQLQFEYKQRQDQNAA